MLGTHNSGIGNNYPNTSVYNAWGDPITHSLCPFNSDVVDHFVNLSRDVVNLGVFDKILIESDFESATDSAVKVYWRINSFFLDLERFCALIFSINTMRLININKILYITYNDTKSSLAKFQSKPLMF